MSWAALQLQVGGIRRQMRTWSALMQGSMAFLGMELCFIGAVAVRRGAAPGWWILLAALVLTPAALLWTRRKTRELCVYLELLPYAIMAGYWMNETEAE